MRRILAGTVFLFIWFMSGGAQAQTYSCAAVPRPVIAVTAEADPAAIVTKHSKAELGAVDLDTQSPWPSSYHTEVGGMMQGMVILDHKVVFSYGKDEASGLMCLTVKKIEVKLRADPTIFIANEFNRDNCWLREIYEHEEKHVAADRALLAKYETQIVDGMNLAFMEPQDYSFGPLPQAEISALQMQTQETVAFALEVMFNKMMRERAARQQAIDSLAEYQHVSSQCS